MLTHLRIKNFKIWRDTGDIRLAPLTVFFGANSSGKSSINQFLLMLRQTAESPDRKRVLHSGDRRTPIDLGTYRDMVYRHHQDEPIWFEFRWDEPSGISRPAFVYDHLSRKGFFARSITFLAEVGLSGAEPGNLVVRTMSYRIEGREDQRLSISMNRREPAKGDYELIADPYELKRRRGRPWRFPEPTRFYGFPEEVLHSYRNAYFLSDLTLALERRLRTVYYLGPLREGPDRLYMWSGEVPEHVGWAGERAVAAILAGRERRISRAKQKKSESFEAIIARWLKQMGLIYSFRVKQVAPDRREYEVTVKAPGTGEDVNLSDVGFGVSQVLPVLVQCFYAPHGSIILMEQPELHLHPSVQASLADLFIEAIQAREDGKDRNIQLLVESHSEHFLIRLQRRIAEGKVSRDDTAIYFCKPTRSGAEMVSLQLDVFGNITNWPEDFFGDRFTDLAEMSKAGSAHRVDGQR